MKSDSMCPSPGEARTGNAWRRRVAARHASRAGALLACLSLVAIDAGARPQGAPAADATWRAECGSCHVAYPPALLPAAEWRGLMSALDRHFGEDASVDAAVATGIERFLVANAGQGKPRAGGQEPRITTTRWFRHEHDEVAMTVFRSARVGSPANCGACHPAAATGDFAERTVAIPR